MRIYFLAVSLIFVGALQAGPCLPGTLNDYTSLDASGCSVSTLQFSAFELVPGIGGATPVDPMLVQVTPGGGSFTPALLLTLNVSATAATIQQLIFRFNVAGPAAGASVALNSPAATGDGVVTGILDVCAGGSFAGSEPSGCTGSPANAIAFATEGDGQPSGLASFPVNSFFDVFVDLTIDPGLLGTAALPSASVTINAVPEPASWTTLILGLGCFAAGIRRARRF